MLSHMTITFSPHSTLVQNYLHKVSTNRNTGIPDKCQPGIPGSQTQRNYPKEQIPGCQERRQQPFPTGTKNFVVCYQQNKTRR